MGRNKTNGQTGEAQSRRSWLNARFIEALAADFETNGIEVIEQLRTQSPRDYARIVADLLPRVQVATEADAFGFKSLDSLEQLIEKMAADIASWGMADRFIALLSNQNGNAGTPTAGK
jgi:hypothetical protein